MVDSYGRRFRAAHPKCVEMIMGFLDRLLGRSSQPWNAGSSRQGGYAASPWSQGGYGSGPQDSVRGGAPRRSSDEEAIARYRYLLETAPPERIEEAHAEAFARLTLDQRRQVLQQLSQAGEPASGGDDPRSLARAATRLEMRRPGSLFSTFGGYGGMGRGGLGMGGMGMGGMGMGSMLLTSVAGSFIGTSIATEMFDHDGFMDWDTGGNDGDSFADGGAVDGGYDGGGENFADGGGFDGGGFDGGFDGGDFGSF